MADDDFADENHVAWEEREVNSRALQQSPENFTGLGDPTAWGGEVEIVHNVAGTWKNTRQVIRTQVTDAYPRNWQMVGTLQLPYAMLIDPVANFNWAAIIDIVIGTGQAPIHHYVNLRALIDQAIPPAMYATGNSWYAPIPQGADEVVVPWLLPATAIVARNISARFQFYTAMESPFPGPTTFRVTAAVCPYAAGANL